MPYRVTMTNGSIEVAFDTVAEGRSVFEAIQPFMPFTAAEATPSRVGAPALRRTASMNRRMKRVGRIAGWVAELKLVQNSAEGIAGREICEHLGVAGTPGLGRALSPVKQILAQRGFDDWTEVVRRERTDDGLVWRAGSRLGEAIAVLEEYEEGRAARAAPPAENGRLRSEQELRREDVL